MADEIGQHEISDNCGSTVVYGGAGVSMPNITTSTSNVPAVAGNQISGVAIDVFGIGGSDLLVSFDNGTSFKTLPKNSFFSFDVKGRPTQLVVKSSSGTITSTDLEIVINFED